MKALQTLVPMVLGKLDQQPLDKGSAGKVHVWSGLAGSKVASGQYVENCHNSTTKLTSTSKFVSVTWPNGGPEVAPWEC